MPDCNPEKMPKNIEQKRAKEKMIEHGLLCRRIQKSRNNRGDAAYSKLDDVSVT